MYDKLRSAADSSGAELKCERPLGPEGPCVPLRVPGLARDGYGAGSPSSTSPGPSRGAPDHQRLGRAGDPRQDQELFKPGVLTADARLVLTNAIYFKGFWAREFSPKLTREAPFHLTARREVAVPMMSQTETFGYLDGGDFRRSS
jgi:hypothetical protein